MSEMIEVYRDDQTILRVMWDGDRIVQIDEVSIDSGSSSNFGLKNNYTETIYFWARSKMEREIASDLSGWEGQSVYSLNRAEHFVVLEPLADGQ